MRRLTRVSALLLALALLTGCAAGRAFRRGEDRARVGDWDAAVTYYRQAMQANPDRAEYRIALERAMLNASRVHFDAARQLEAKDQLDGALLEYRRTIEYDPGNRQALERVVQLEKTIRDRIEASRPKPAIVQLREQARQLGAAPLLNPASRAPFDISFKQSSLRDILTFISNATGINVIYDASFQDRPITIQLQGSVEQALNMLLSSQGLFYTVLDERTIVVAQDTAPNRLKYERQVAITLPISYADATEIAQMLTAITRTTTGVTIPPVIIPNKTSNTITVRATQPVVDVIQALVLSNDKPRAEITLDVEILEVSRTRTKELGLDLSAHQIGAIFSPEQAPPGSAGATSWRNNRSLRKPAVQPEHDYTGRQHGGFLSRRSAGHHQFSRDGCKYPFPGADAASRFGRRSADLQGRIGRTLFDDVLFADRRRWRQRESAVVLHVPHRRHQRSGHAASRD